MTPPLRGLTTDTAPEAPSSVVMLAPPDVDAPERDISLGRRIRSPQTLISFVIAIALIAFIFLRLDINFSEVWQQARHANPWLLALGFAAYYGSFPLRAARWRRLLSNAQIDKEHGFDVPGVRGLSEIYVLSWFANCVVPAKLGDAYRGYLLKKHAGTSFTRTLGTILAERLLDVVALVVMMILAGLVAFHGTVPASLRVWFIAGGALAVVGVLGLVGLIVFGHHVERFLPLRVRPHYLRLHEGIVSSFARGRFFEISALTVIVWILEGARVFAVAHALHVPLSVEASVFVSLLASLITTFPITPAGLGAVEGGMITALSVATFHVTSSQAAAIALIDRGIAYWSVILVGGLLYLVTKRK
jgi:glycosyltransferase 2 family protein